MYKILPLKIKIQKAIRDLPPSYKEKLLDDVFPDIENSPYWHPAGKISSFKGDLKHLGWHYDLSYKLRIHYEVDEETKEITVTFIGSHPKYK